MTHPRTASSTAPAALTASAHRSRYWADWTTRDFAEAQTNGTLAQTIAVLPVAATEQHGPHLPLKVDSALVDGVIAASLPHLPAQVNALFLPTQTIGLSPEHAAFAGTLTLSSETVVRLWTDIAESVAASGLTKILLLNSHGGQVGLLDVVARDLRARLGLLVYSANWFGLPLMGPQGEDVNALFSAHEHRFGIHAGDIETSMMLALDPVHVHMQHAENFASTSETRAAQFAILGNGKSAKLGWQMQDYNPAGAVGNAQAATAAKGQAVLQAAGQALAQLLQEMHALPDDTLRNKI
jgi:creatinine amidohydrolase